MKKRVLPPLPPLDPTTIVAEILGQPSHQMRNPVNADYLCPFINSTCIKRSQRFKGPYPVCTIMRRPRGKEPELICVCPKRFYQVDFLTDVIAHCWPGQPPANPQFAHEVKMAGFGQVDFVIADVEPDGAVKTFVSVELQAVDITGSCEPAYSAAISSEMLDTAPLYGFNYANVRKRYLTQVVTKGFYHHHWGSRIVAVVQDHIYDSMRGFAAFDELPVDSPTANIVFMLYRYEGNKDEGYRLVFDRAVGTSHSSLMMGVLYRTPPSRDTFIDRIKSRL